MLVPHLASIGDHGEHPAGTGDQLDRGGRQPFSDFRGQTGRAWLVVSNLAVLDGDLHGGSLAGIIQGIDETIDEDLLVALE